jgi:nucleoside-diphosphate-sugar epimerase
LDRSCQGGRNFRPMSQPLIVLTGAAGRLGAPTHRTLLEAGKNVRATDRVRTVSPSRPLVKGNLFDPSTCRRILQDAKLLVHLAYRREPYWYRNGNTHQTFDDHILLNRNVFLAACEAGVEKIIFSSSVQVIARQFPLSSADQPPRYLPLDENLPPEPDNWCSAPHFFVGLASKYFVGKDVFGHAVSWVADR